MNQLLGRADGRGKIRKLPRRVKKWLKRQVQPMLTKRVGHAVSRRRICLWWAYKTGEPWNSWHTLFTLADLTENLRETFRK